MITVLRIGHRIDRDKRITTHVALVARAFGAQEILISTKDQTIEDTIHSVCDRFGGEFQIKTGVNPKEVIKNWDGVIVHLTMYGDQLDDALNHLNTNKNLLIIIGAEKVPPYFFDAADWNIAIGNQPHSEVAALAIFLDRYTRGNWITTSFDGNVEIIPSKKGKNVRVKPIGKR